ncbi:SIMPL domain-containing protein [Georgenia yuyongxinii]|uniref:DUF541 domain-containing protein n=1 Tax=Georgenia yuyongxinii TaxID=2589797 RepID=A0A552WJP1_9MICO|nr:SIMPL domain-containing protein [Georgenia yuyongxinii]TRW42904.1 DUF541 domain-containing protein [Georgenia yuyongxinii]
MPTTIAVTGEFEVRRAAERGTVRLSLGFEGPSREGVVQRCTRLHEKIGEGLSARHDPADGPVTEWSSDQLRVWGERPWNQEGTQLPVVFHAAAGASATFADFTALSAWLTEVSLVDGVTVEGVTWDLTEQTRAAVTEDARRGAVAAAVHKAGVYAAAVGLADVRVTAVADPGLLADGGPPVPREKAGRMAAFAMDAAPGLDLRPAEITVEALVHARFDAG